MQDRALGLVPLMVSVIGSGISRETVYQYLRASS